MPIRNFDDNAFVAFTDISGFKNMVDNRERAEAALHHFFQTAYDLLDENTGNRNPSVEGILVSDCGVLFVRPNQARPLDCLRRLLNKIEELNRRLLPHRVMLSTSIGYGHFRYQDSGWAVFVNEQEENFKIQDLERKIFTPARNQVMCEGFLKEAQRDPSGKIGKSIVFAVNQTHATNLTKIFNELQPGIAVTITSRIQDASSIAKEFRDGKRAERIAVSVDMLSTGYT